MEKAKEIYFKYNFIFEFIISIFFSIGVVGLSYYKIIYNVWDLRYVLLTIITGFFILLFIISNTIKFKKCIERLFLTYIIPIGMLFVIALLPSYVPDEEVHIFRAYEISNGQFISKFENEGTISIPNVIKENVIMHIDNYSQLINALKNKDNTLLNNDGYISVPHSAQNYFPILYIFSAIGFWIGKVLSLNIIITMYLAKIFNFIAFLILGYYSIKKIPFGKLLLAIYLMMPMMIHQGTSISADCLTNAICLFFIAYTLSIAFKKDDLTKKEEILYYFISAIIGVTKIVYIPLVFANLVIIWNKNIEKNKKIRLIIISALICCLIGGIWYLFSSNYIDIRPYIEEHNVNSTEQIKFILTHPQSYIKTFLHTLHQGCERYIYQFIGSQLGWLNIKIPTLVIIAYMFLLLFSPFLEKNDLELTKKQKIIFILFALISFMLVFVALYSIWTGVGENEILGVQGRYFIPIMLLFLLCLCGKNRFIYFKNTNVTCFIVATLLNISAIQHIILFFAK